MFTQNTKYKKGFSVLFASLTGSLVLAIGLAILSITIKQITLASAGRESQKAFYAADTGVECALFLDAGAGNLDDGGNPICPQGIFGIPNEANNDILDQCGLEAGEYSFNGNTRYQCVGALFDPDPDATTGNTISRPSLEVDEFGVNFVRTEFSVKSSVDDLCFNVTVDKTRNTTDGNLSVATKVVSRGFSTCETANKNRFERAIRVKY